MENKTKENVGFFDGFGTLIKGGLEKRRTEPSSLLFDAAVIIIAFLFSRCHVIFGAYPLGVAFVAVLPRGVWLGLIGAVAGALSLGKTGIIHAIITVIVIFIRIIISGGGKDGDAPLFSEPLLLRISASSIGAFVGAAYEILLGGFALKSILYGICSVLLSAVFTFTFAGIFDGGVSFSDFLYSKRRIFSDMKSKSEKERFGLYLFQAVFLLFVFLISISMKEYSLLGISPSYIFSAAVTLVVARRFGAVRAMTVGFVSSLGISSIYSVAFALVGLGAGMLFNAGVTYALVGAGVLLSAWSAYAGGTVGFLSTFPEYVTAALLSVPLIRKISPNSQAEDKETVGCAVRDATDMVNATALAYRNGGDAGIDGLEAALHTLAPSLKALGLGESRVTLSEYRDMTIECTKAFCRDCHFYQACVAENPAPCVENMDAIAAKLYKKERLFADDASILPKYCHNARELFEAVENGAAALEEEKFKGRKIEAIAEEYELCSKLIGEVRTACGRERGLNSQLSEKLGELLERVGLHGGVIKVFGERRKYFIGAGEDKDGSVITSDELRRGIEETAGVKLGAPDYYRKGDAALFECRSVPMYAVEFSAAGCPSLPNEPSGDTAISFESADGHFYSLIADGMGSGEEAHRTSHFTADFLSKLLESPCTKSTALHMLNHIIKNRSEECSSTVDLFDFDLITGEALFFKCGAAPSYVKRDSSIFRIRSETAPLGLMKSIDAEKIRVEVKSGDYVIMLSDGVSQSAEDSTWLLELLSKPAPSDIRDYADTILSAAHKHSKSRDDMSVAVARIVRI